MVTAALATGTPFVYDLLEERSYCPLTARSSWQISSSSNAGSQVEVGAEDGNGLTYDGDLGEADANGVHLAVELQLWVGAGPV